MKKLATVLRLLVMVSFIFTGLQAQIMITEIMQNPSAVLDADGEWFELYNAGGSDVDINGWTMEDNGTNSHVINNGSPLIIPAGGFLVLGNNSEQSTNGNLPIDYEYSSFTLANGDDEVILLDDSSPTPVEIDRIEYDGGSNWPDPAGSSMVFIGSPTDENNDYNNWITSSSRELNYLGSTGDNGSPGTIGSDQSLPVELSSFTAKGLDSQVELSWTTQSEVDNAGFEVFRSQDRDGEYTQISSYTRNDDLKGHGSTSEIHHYSYVDNTVANEITYYYKLRDVSVNGEIGEHGPVNATPRAQDDEETPAPLVTEFKLHNAYPNPFNPGTTLSFSVHAKAGEKVQVTLDIYNLAGVKVCSLVNEKMGATELYETTWNAANNNGQTVTNGVYFAVLRAGELQQVQKLVLLK